MDTTTHPARPDLDEIEARLRARIHPDGGTTTSGNLRADLQDAADALETDAARYRWLRERDLDTITKGGVFAGMTPKNVVLNGEDLDRAVDEARGSAPSTPGETLAGELARALADCLPLLEKVEDATLVGHEGCLWPVENARDLVRQATATGLLATPAEGEATSFIVLPSSLPDAEGERS
jgi:hypothetical protein